MKAVVGVLLGIIVGISSFVIILDHHDGTSPRISAADLLVAQKAILDLFDDVCEVSKNLNVTSSAEQFSLEHFFNGDQDNLLGVNKEAVLKFKEVYGNNGEGLTRKQDAFYEFSSVKLDELKAVYGILYHAKHFESFYKIAAWARQNLNCEIFVDALYAAIIHRKDTQNISVPPPYEVLPHYFIHRDGLIKALMIENSKDLPLGDFDGIHNDGNVITVDTNYTGAFFDNQDETKLAYFREDVGLNSFYYFTKLRKAPWIHEVNNQNVKNLGEYWYYITRQLNARYNLERVTNGLKQVEGITWTNPFTADPYDPVLINRNGNYFPARTNFVLEKPENFTELSKIRSNFDTILNNMEMNKSVRMDSVLDFITSSNNHYDFLARWTLGKEENEEDVISGSPSALQHYATTLRDPVFWRLNKHYLDIFNEALNGIEPYAHNQLYFPGVEIINIEVKKMQTFFDYNEIEIANSVTQSKVDNVLRVKIGQPRLNHKPFSILINVSSLVSQKALVKIFIGPKFSPSEINIYKDLLKQLDSFEYFLKVGNNAIVRKSDDINNIADDLVSLEDLHRHVETVTNGFELFNLRNIESIIGFPSRSVLPKGTAEGFPLQLYVIVAPFLKSQSDGIFDLNTEVLSLSFPFDRPIEDSKLYDLSNTMFKDIIITHKGDNKVYDYGGSGASKKWYLGAANTYNPDEKKSYDYQTKKQSGSFKKNPGSYDYQTKKQSGSYNKNSGSYDYASKKEQYKNKKYDYESKKNYESTVKPQSEEDQFKVIPVQSSNDLNILPLLPASQKFVLDHTKNEHVSKDSDQDYNLNSDSLKYNDEKFKKPILNLQLKSPFTQNSDLKSKKGSYNDQKSEKHKLKTVNSKELAVGKNSKEVNKQKNTLIGLNKERKPDKKVNKRPDAMTNDKKLKNVDANNKIDSKITYIDVDGKIRTIFTKEKHYEDPLKFKGDGKNLKKHEKQSKETSEEKYTDTTIRTPRFEGNNNKIVDIEENGQKIVHVDRKQSKDGDENFHYAKKSITSKPMYYGSATTEKYESDTNYNNFDVEHTDTFKNSHKNTKKSKQSILRSSYENYQNPENDYNENKFTYDDFITWTKIHGLGDYDRYVYY